MKNVIYFLSLLLIVGFSSCSDDDDFSTGDLSYDSANARAPLFQPGTQIAAARFSLNELQPFIGQSLSRVEFYIEELPAKCEIRIYDELNNLTPGNIVYQADVTNSLRASSFNEHALTSTVEITEDDLWIGVFVETSVPSEIIGCDDGPAVQDGDWLFESSDNAWETFRDRTGNQVSINWNIRGFVD